MACAVDVPMPAPLLIVAVLAAGLSPAAAASAVAPPSPAEAALQLRAIDARVVATQRLRDPAWIETLLDRDFLLTDRNGNWLEREEFLARQREPALFAEVDRNQLQVRLFGEVAVLHGVLHGRTPSGERLQLRTTDVYAWQDGRWQLVSMQHTPMRADASADTAVAAPAITAPWRGTDPQGDDFMVLTALNAQYVQAFRAADAAWYDAHLAPDYQVVSGNGSLQQRVGALADFATPYFAQGIAEFPLDQVQIRLYGDLALIHAENAYTLKDGRKGVNRYTDLWLKRDGRWWCVAAHITVRQPPA